MFNYNLRIISLDAGNIFINGDFVGFIDNKENFSIDLQTSNKQLVITKEPISNNKDLLLPYTVIVKTSGGVECNSNYASVVPFSDNNYDVILKPCEIKQSKDMLKVFDNYVGGYNLVVVNNGQSLVNLYSNNSLKYSAILDEITNIVAEKRNNYIVIKGQNVESNYHIIILDEENNFNEIVNTTAEQVDETEHEIKILTTLNDIAKHASVYVINTTNKEQNKQYFVYLNNKATTTNSKQLIPYAFLEAIKVGNYNLAKSYLSENLQKDTTKKHLESYFENLKEIHYNTHNQNQNIVNYTLHCNEFRSFNFYISNSKITEIEEVPF